MWKNRKMSGAKKRCFTTPHRFRCSCKQESTTSSHSFTPLQSRLAHMSHRRTSSLVKGVLEVIVGGSHLCSALLHTRICPCHERVLQFLDLSGVLGSSFDLFHLLIDQETHCLVWNREDRKTLASLMLNWHHNKKKRLDGLVLTGARAECSVRNQVCSCHTQSVFVSG